MRYTEVSCPKFLDALAKQLAILYDFDFRHGYPTIGDVLYAVDNNAWEFRTRKGEQLTTIELPAFLEKDEWQTIKDLNEHTDRRIHDGLVPTASPGRLYIILPRGLYNDDEVKMLKSIVPKGLDFTPADLKVEDEEEVERRSRTGSALQLIPSG